MGSQQSGVVWSQLAWSVLKVVLLIEGVGGVFTVWGAVNGVFVSANDPLAQRVSVLLALILSWVWVVVTFAGSRRGRAAWVRGSAVTIHVFMFAAGTGVLQGIFAETVVGWVLVLLACVGGVAAIVARPERQDTLE